MNFIKPSVEIIDEPDVFKRIEIGARVCWKSDDRICDGSAKKMVEKLIKRGHESPLEHSSITVILKNEALCDEMNQIISNYDVIVNVPHFIKFTPDEDGNVEYTANVRAWRSLCRYAKDEPLLASTLYRAYPDLFGDVFDNPEIIYENIEVVANSGNCDRNTIVTARFTCDRGVSHELVRHRLFAISQESSRYVSYKDGLTLIEPWWWPEQETAETQFVRASCQSAEDAYCSLVKMGCSPQEARCVLPNMLKTEVVATGTVEYWKKYVLPLRLSKAAHPDMRRLMTLFCEQMNWDPTEFTEEKK